MSNQINNLAPNTNNVSVATVIKSRTYDLCTDEKSMDKEMLVIGNTPPCVLKQKGVGGIFLGESK